MTPNSIRLFHITAIDNLADICQAASLLCKSNGVAQGIQYQNIAHSGAQGARASREVLDPPGGRIHDFVPFYFAPRSPMLSAIHNGRVVGCDYKQEDILHFETTVARATQPGQDFIFYDRNATLLFSEANTDIDLLPSKIAWDLLTEDPQLDGFCKYFFNKPSDAKYIDRMERRQAEFLVKQSVPLICMTKIGVINEEKAQIVCAILADYGVELNVEIMNDWYFLGQ